MRLALIRRTGFVSFSAVVTFLTSSVTPTTAPADSGIAARYPGDKNIANDPAVIFADDFESYTSPSQLTSKWSSAYQPSNLRIATEQGNYYAGSKALEMTLPVSTSEVANALRKTLLPEQDTVYLRVYTKFAANYNVVGSNHNGLDLRGKYPGPGIKPPTDGTGFFLFTINNNIQGAGRPGEVVPGYSQLYCYWPFQRDVFGDHWFSDGYVVPYDNTIGNKGLWLAYPTQYPDFRVIANWQPQLNKWYCYELMVKLNTPGQNDGEVKHWIDGNVVGDFPNLFIRSISTLKVDMATIALHALHSEQVNKKYYDNVVVATQYIGPMVGASPIPSPTPAPTAHLQNISGRLLIQTGNNVGIAGFVVGGTEAKKVLIRGLGPTLAQFNVTGVMQNPTLELHDGRGSLITTNDNWKDTQQAEITATQLAPPADVEAAILATLQPGAYTAIQTDARGGTGVGLIEVYDVDPLAASRLINISTRGLVQTGNNVLIGGFSLAAGSGSNNVVVRALGPSLAPFGVNNALPDPFATLYDSNGNVITANDNWKDSQQSAIENTGLQPPNDLDAAILVRLAAGNYTAIVTDKSGSTGVALVEVYVTQ